MVLEFRARGAESWGLVGHFRVGIIIVGTSPGAHGGGLPSSVEFGKEKEARLKWSHSRDHFNLASYSMSSGAFGGGGSLDRSCVMGDKCLQQTCTWVFMVLGFSEVWLCTESNLS